jgi:ubiquinone/menaquinone biosynthesis C-methylase UbiE
MDKYVDLLDESLPFPDHPRRTVWRDYALSGEERAQQPLDRIERVFGLNGRTLVDIGCGDGGFSIAARRRGCKVIAIDISPQALRRASARYSGRHVEVDLIRGSGLQLPIKDNTCDVVVLQDVLEHVSSPVGLLRESIRVLRSGGVCYVSAVNAHYLRYIFSDPHWGIFGVALLPHKLGKLYICDLLKVSPVYDVWELPTPEKIDRWLYSAGFWQLQDQVNRPILHSVFNQAVISALGFKPQSGQGKTPMPSYG